MSARNQRGSRPQDPESRRNLRKGSRRAPLWDSHAAGPGVDAAGARPPGLCAGGAHLLVSARGLRGRHRIWQTFEGLLGCSVGTETDGCHLCALSLPFSSPKVTFFLSFSSVFPAITTNSLRFAPASVHYPFFFFFLSWPGPGTSSTLSFCLFPAGGCALPLLRSSYAPVSPGVEIL